MRVRVNDTQIYFDIEGAKLEVRGDRLAEKPTLIALHGGPGFDHGYLKPGLKPLCDHAQLIYVDLRGQGRSGRPPIESCTLEQMADDVASLCELLGVERPLVFGHSAGGFVAMHLALRYPQLPGGLILCDSSPALGSITDDLPRPTLESRAGPEEMAIAGRLFGGDFSAEAVAEFQARVVPYYAGPSHMDVPGRLFSLTDMATDIAAHFFTKLAASYDLRPRLHEITLPTLVIVGRHDWVCSPAASRAIARGIPGAKLVELADSGHFGFSEQPAEFLAAVTGFLDRPA